MAKARNTKSKPATPITPVEESKRDRFIRIGNARVQRALNSIRLLGNLANSNYEWDEADVQTMQNAIVETLSRTVARFSKKRVSVPDFGFEKVSDL